MSLCEPRGNFFGDGFVWFPLQEEEGEDGGNQDGHSVSSDLLDLLLEEDQSGTSSAESGTGSAESGSLVSSSNSSGSHGTSGCATGRPDNIPRWGSRVGRRRRRSHGTPSDCL